MGREGGGTLQSHPPGLLPRTLGWPGRPGSAWETKARAEKGAGQAVRTASDQGVTGSPPGPNQMSTQDLLSFLVPWVKARQRSLSLKPEPVPMANTRRGAEGWGDSLPAPQCSEWAKGHPPLFSLDSTHSAGPRTVLATPPAIEHCPGSPHTHTLCQLHSQAPGYGGIVSGGGGSARAWWGETSTLPSLAQGGLVVLVTQSFWVSSAQSQTRSQRQGEDQIRGSFLPSLSPHPLLFSSCLNQISKHP